MAAPTALVGRVPNRRADCPRYIVIRAYAERGHTMGAVMLLCVAQRPSGADRPAVGRRRRRRADVVIGPYDFCRAYAERGRTMGAAMLLCVA